MITQNKLQPMATFLQAAKAPLEHMFDNHTFCNADWCNGLKAKAEGKTYIHPDKNISKSTPEGGKMYAQLSAITEKYGTEFYQKQSARPFNTQTNEALNQAQACLTPKNKSFHESQSFHHRHAIVVGSHNWGLHRYWTEVFSNLGVPYTKYFSDHLTCVDTTRKRWEKQSSKQVVKRTRAYKQDAIEQQLLYKNRTKEYASGLGLDIGNSATATTPARKRSK